MTYPASAASPECSILTTGAARVALRCACPRLLFPKPRKAAVHLFFRPTDACLLHNPFVLSPYCLINKCYRRIEVVKER
jgi:hypothetical protein